MGMLNETEICAVLEGLAKAYPDADCALHFQTPYQLLAAVMLSAQTTDKKVNEVTKDLFHDYPTAKEMIQIPEETLQQILRPIGFYRNKASHLLALSRMLVEQYDGEVPEDQSLLEKLPGIGRKSANVVMSVAFGHPRIAVDTHVFRVSNRIGLADEKDVLKTEQTLMRVIPEAEWTRNHHRLIWHGRQICHARKPECSSCPVAENCLWYRQKKMEAGIDEQ